MSVPAHPGIRSRRRPRALLAPLALVLLLGPTLAACGGDEAMSDKAGSAAPADPGPAEANGFAGAGSGDAGDQDAREASAGGDAATASPASVTGRQVIRTAALTVEVKDLTAAASSVRALGPSLGGLVAAERSQRPDTGEGSATTDPGESVIELRVPEDRLDEALTRLAALGRERGRTMTSEDVTAQIADLDGRIATQRQALVRVRQLLGRASSVKDILELEQDLTRRESDLEGLQRRVAALRGQAALSTVTVTLVTPAGLVQASDADEPRTGFVGGLKGGWDALTSTFVVLSAIVGALLPWVVPAAAVVAVVVLVRRRWGARIAAWRRSRRRYGATPWPVPPTPTPTTSRTISTTDSGSDQAPPA